jgi:spoIIIJ-associated protein
MTEQIDANRKIVHLIDLLKTSGGLLIDAQIVEGVSESSAHSAALSIKLSGEDAPLFVRNNGELLKALHQVAAAALQLEGEQHELLWFDVNDLRANHMDQMRRIANDAVVQVRATGERYAFTPMLSCERHMLHQALAPSGLKFSSEGDGTERCVVLYPEETARVQYPSSSPVLRPQDHHGAA